MRVSYLLRLKGQSTAHLYNSFFADWEEFQEYVVEQALIGNEVQLAQ